MTYNSLMELDSFKDKKVGVLGFGIEGESAIEFSLLQKASKIVVFDLKPRQGFESQTIKRLEKRGVVFEFESQKIDSSFELLVRSPGVPIDSQPIKQAKQLGIKITSTTQIFFDFCPCPIIGVTGTKGKGTTSTLIYEIIKMEEDDVFLGGNIGNSPLSFLDKLNPASLVVLELSSFQLQDLKLSPHIAVVLMVTEDHLEVHKSIDSYTEAKRAITTWQTDQDYLIANTDYANTSQVIAGSKAKLFEISSSREVTRGCYVSNQKIICEGEDIIDVSEVFIPGKHNWENVCAAVMAAKIIGISTEAIPEAVKNFKGLPHRLELVRNLKGVKYYDDSFATAPSPSIAAIKAFKAPKILILGGSPKKSDFSELGELISHDSTIKAIIGIGIEWPQIKLRIQNAGLRIRIIEGCKNMEEIVSKAAEIAEPGDVVILSPACASFDMFKNYKDRGDQFKERVRKLN